MSSTTSPYWPWPPDCFLCRPRCMMTLLDGLAIADRGLASIRSATPKRSASRSVATRRCISPCPHNTTSCASALWTTVIEGSSSSSLLERLAKLDVVLALLGGDRDRQHRRMRRDLDDRRMRPACRRSACRRSWHDQACRAPPSRRPRRGRASRCVWPMSLNTPATRPASRSGVTERRTVADLAGEHARDRHLAAVRGVHASSSH